MKLYIFFVALGIIFLAGSIILPNIIGAQTSALEDNSTLEELLDQSSSQNAVLCQDNYCTATGLFHLKFNDNDPNLRTQVKSGFTGEYIAMRPLFLSMNTYAWSSPSASGQCIVTVDSAGESAGFATPLYADPPIDFLSDSKYEVGFDSLPIYVCPVPGYGCKYTTKGIPVLREKGTWSDALSFSEQEISYSKMSSRFPAEYRLEIPHDLSHPFTVIATRIVKIPFNGSTVNNNGVETTFQNGLPVGEAVMVATVTVDPKICSEQTNPPRPTSYNEDTNQLRWTYNKNIDKCEQLPVDFSEAIYSGDFASKSECSLVYQPSGTGAQTGEKDGQITTVVINMQENSTLTTMSVEVSPSSAILNIGETQQLTVLCMVSQGSSSGNCSTLGAKISFTSNNTSVATVNSNGLVTAIAGGSANITVTATKGAASADATAVILVNTPTPTPPPQRYTCADTKGCSPYSTGSGCYNWEVKYCIPSTGGEYGSKSDCLSACPTKCVNSCPPTWQHFICDVTKRCVPSDSSSDDFFSCVSSCL